MKALIPFFGLLVSAHAFSAEPAKSCSLASFRASGIYAVQSGKHSTASAELSWNPMVGIGNSFAILGNFGLTGYQTQLGNTFAVLDLQLLAQYRLASGAWALELGGGDQSWNEGGQYTHGGAGTLNLVYAFPQKISLAQGAVFGFTAASLSSRMIYQVHAGLAF